MIKVLEVKKVQTLISRETRTTQALKIYIKLKGILLSILLDTEASVSAISKNLIQKLQLKIKTNDRIRVSPLGGNSKIKVIGLIKEASLLVQYIQISEILYVVKGIKTILILGTNWFDKYQVDIRRSDNKIKIIYQGKKA